MSTFTVHHGKHYRATVILKGIERLASNATVASRLSQVGFDHVTVTGSGGTRQAEGRWTGPDTTAQLDAHLTQVSELPA
jgi:hypothetical protein